MVIKWPYPVNDGIYYLFLACVFVKWGKKYSVYVDTVNDSACFILSVLVYVLAWTVMGSRLSVEVPRL